MTLPDAPGPAVPRSAVSGAAVPATADAGDTTELDSIILSCAQTEWQRVTMLIAATVDATKAQALDVKAQTIASRIYALTDAKQLDSKGNIRRWRTSEIRISKKV